MLFWAAEWYYHMLQHCGYAVVAAGDGQAAVARVRAHHSGVSLVLLDLVMPQQNGLQVLQELQRIRRDVPIVFMSRFSAEQLAAVSSSMKPAGFLQKPFTLRQLCTHLQQVRLYKRQA